MTELVCLPLKELYLNTLYRVQPVLPWGCDNSGRFVGLQYRYDFTSLVLNKDHSLAETDIRATDYWEFLNVPLTRTPHDGGAKWVYHDPWAQVQRFIQLIRSLRQHGYITEQQSEPITTFDTTAPPHLEVDAEGMIVNVSYKDRAFQGLISVRRFNKTYHCWNGHHRLAALACMHDRGDYKSDTVLVTAQKSVRGLRRIFSVLHKRIRDVSRS